MYEGDDLSTLEEEENPPEESGNKTFMIWAGILGGIILLSIACVAAYAFLVLPKQAAARDAQQATLVAQDVGVNQTLTVIAQNEMLSQTPLPTFTPTVTNTPVIVNQNTTPGAPALVASDPQTATVIAALTQAAQAQQTIALLPTSTQLPATGFADESGAAGLVVMAIALVAVILLARRLRSTPLAH
jgi:hypothetical protein